MTLHDLDNVIPACTKRVKSCIEQSDIVGPNNFLHAACCRTTMTYGLHNQEAHSRTLSWTSSSIFPDQSTVLVPVISWPRPDLGLYVSKLVATIMLGQAIPSKRQYGIAL